MDGGGSNPYDFMHFLGIHELPLANGWQRTPHRRDAWS
jgi:hypothetical protein